MADIEAINDVNAAKAWLVKNKDKVGAFEARYGKGSALAVLQNTYVKPDIPDQPEETLAQKRERSAVALSRRPRMTGDQNIDLGNAIVEAASIAGNQALDIIQGVGRGFIGAPTEILETQANAGRMGTEDAQSLYDKTITYRNEVLAKQGLPAMTPEEEKDFAQRMGVGLASGGIAVRDDRVDYDTQDVIDALGLTDALEVDTMAGSLAEGFSQFVTGYVLLGGGGGIVRSLATGAGSTTQPS